MKKRSFIAASTATELQKIMGNITSGKIKPSRENRMRGKHRGGGKDSRRCITYPVDSSISFSVREATIDLGNARGSKSGCDENDP